MPYLNKEPESPFLTSAEAAVMNPIVHATRHPEPREPCELPAVLDRGQLAALDQAVIAADAAVAAAERRGREAKARRDGLSARLERTREDVPRDYRALDDTLVDALASDPTTEHAPADLAAAAARQTDYRAQRDAWQAQVDLIGQAIGKVDAEIAAIEQEVADLRVAREGEWKAFLVGANNYLAGILQERFAVLRDEIIQPMLDLEALEIGGAQLLRTTGAWRLDHDPSLKLFRTVEVANRFHGRIECQRDTVTLLDSNHRQHRILNTSDAIERFRVSLASAG